MLPLRRRLSCLAVCWLSCQLAGFVAAPLVLGTTSPMTATEPACDCPGTLPGQACPMHKGHAESQRDENACQLRNAYPSDAGLLALTGSIAVLPVPSIVAVELAPVAIGFVVLNPIARAELPEAPPPRA